MQSTPTRACGAPQFLSFDPRTFVVPDPTVPVGDGRPRAAIYARVPTSRQNPETQLCQLREYARHNYWRVAGEFRDIDSDRATPRLGVTNMLMLSKFGNFDLVVTTHLSILGYDLADCVLTIRALNAANVRFLAAAQPVIDTGESASSGASLVGILSAVAESVPTISKRRPAGLEILAHMREVHQ